jgi:hypothetical protein
MHHTQLQTWSIGFSETHRHAPRLDPKKRDLEGLGGGFGGGEGGSLLDMLFSDGETIFNRGLDRRRGPTGLTGLEARQTEC